VFDSTAYFSKLVILQSLELLFFGFRAVVIDATAGVIWRRGTHHGFKIADSQPVSCQPGEGDLKKEGLAPRCGQDERAVASVSSSTSFPSPFYRRGLFLQCFLTLQMTNERPVVPNTSGPMMTSQLSHSRSSVKKLRLEGSMLGTDGEEKS
jgi:hypothetical protein